VSATLESIAETVECLRQQTNQRPSVGLILGSGLSSLVDEVSSSAMFPYAEIPHFPTCSVDGHLGRLVIGQLGGKTVMAMQGRPHFYEGYTMDELAFPVRVMRAMGVEVLIATNAAGGLNPTFRPGDLMLITDHVNLPGMAGHSPLVGPPEPALGVRFPSMHACYDPDLIALADETASAAGFSLVRGVYAMVAGPSYETPAEIRFLQQLGADAVGMSTVPEVLVARHGGMRVLGISVISNICTGSCHEEVCHEEVLAASARLQPCFSALVKGLINRI
jgi:purine-nucleoside phosphorylase